jgi:6-pyruvoyltetrahydropterin/6-carboxytetrahydropterin synthase
MYKIKKTFEISASHKLILNYDSPCKREHGHNWKITVYCKSANLDNNSMVIDFAEIKSIIKSRMDHKCLNDVFDFNTTAENIAYWVVQNIPKCYKCEVKESKNNTASYEKN